MEISEDSTSNDGRMEENVLFTKMLEKLAKKAKETNEFFKIKISDEVRGNQVEYFEETHGISPSELKKKTLRGNIYHALLKFNELNEGGKNEHGLIEKGNLLEKFYEQYCDSYLDCLPDEEKIKLDSVEYKDLKIPLEGFVEYMQEDNLYAFLIPHKN